MADTGERAAASGAPHAVIDACVMVPATVRGVLLYAAAQDAFRPAWSEPILRETRGTLLRREMMDRDGVQAFDRALRRAFPEAWVPERDIRAVEPQMRNDPKDRHVLAAAVAGGAPWVITTNLKDFRPGDLKPVGVRAVHPDAFLSRLLERSPNAMRVSLEAQAARARVSPGQLLGHLKGLGAAQPMAPRFADRVEEQLGIRPVTPAPRSLHRASPSRPRMRQPPSLSR